GSDAKGFRRAFASLALVLALVSACASWTVPVRSNALVHNDTNRSYRLYVPEAVRAKGGPVPLVLVLQGALSFPDIMDITRMTLVAEREGFAVAFPHAAGDLWNDGAVRVLGANTASDVTFLRRVVADIDAKEL